MVKAYLRYEAANKFGVIASNANLLYSADGKLLYSPALEDVAVWSVKQGSLVAVYSPTIASTSSGATAAPEVTQLALSPSGTQLAAGYADGSVRVWDTSSATCTVTLQGHKTAVSALHYSSAGDLLASGGKDTDVIVWDVVGEAGLYRLRGHKDQVTDLAFLPAHNKLVSSSKDGSLRVWDLAGQRCSQVVTGFKAEVWSMDVNTAHTRLVAGGVEVDLQVYAVAPPATSSSTTATAQQHEVLSHMGSVRRSAQERVAQLRFDGRSSQLGCLSGGKTLEVFRVLSEEAARKKQKRRKKRKAEKQAAKRNKGARTAEGAGPGAAAAAEHKEGSSDSEEEHGPEAGGQQGEEAPVAADELVAGQVIVSKHKVRSFAFAPSAGAGVEGGGRGGGHGQVAISLANNSIEVVALKEGGWDTTQQLQQAGHRSDVRCLALSSDDNLLFSASSAGAKLWNPTSGACLGSMDCGYGLCAVFAPGNKQVVVGTKEGTLELFDLGACTRVHVEQAHGGPVWSLALLPDKSGFLSGSADKTVKVWTWTVNVIPVEAPPAPAEAEVEAGGKKSKKKAAAAAAAEVERPVATRKVLGITCTRQLEAAEDVLCVRVSPDGRLLAVALLDATIKVYYLDTFKFFLSLYGHKLPVLTMDISSDSTLLISGSADKNIKVWGLDFGDCHRSLFAHQDTVTCLSFVRDTHYAFSTGKDGLLKYWDLDRWEMLLELPGHQGAAWGLAVSAYGDFVVTGSQDRSLRRWARSQEPFFVEEEKEKRLDSLFEADLQQQQARDEAADKQQQGDQQVQGAAVAPAGRKTLETVAAADALVDALEMAAHEDDKQQEYERAAAAAAGSGQTAPAPPLPNPLMLGLAPSAYVLRCLGGIRAADLEQALLLLSFTDALRLLQYLAGWCQQGAQAELCCRVAVLLLRLHHGAMTSTPSARPTLLALHQHLRPALQRLKDTLGFNCAALRHLQRAAKEGSVSADAVLAGGGAELAAARQLLRGEA